jgi:SAM-dependent methyltransferase
VSNTEYVHGYSAREADRLADQAATLADLLHHDTRYPAGSRVLEAGCGVGGQTVTLAANSPECRITSLDISPESLAQARARAEEAGLTNVTFRQGDLFYLDFPDEHFDHVFVCFVLEHLRDPLGALRRLMRVLKTGGTITVIEGDHGSFYCHPETPEAKRAVECLVRRQAALGGDACIGRRLFPLLDAAGLRDVRVSPRMVYVDSSRPCLVEGFSKKTFIAMVEGVEHQALAEGLIDRPTWDKGIRDLYRATEHDGTFCYTFFKGVAMK